MRLLEPVVDETEREETEPYRYNGNMKKRRTTDGASNASSLQDLMAAEHEQKLPETDRNTKQKKTSRKTSSKKKTGFGSSSRKASGKESVPVKSRKKSLENKEKKPRHMASWLLTLLLLLGNIALVLVLWALFVGGPSRIHDEQQQSALEAIEQQVPGVQGLQETIFDYVTWQGYTEDTLYWFDGNGSVITTRDLGTLDYEKAKAKAKDEYGIEADTIQTAYGYSAPCYEIRGSGKLLLLDYDTLEWIYEREDE